MDVKQGDADRGDGGMDAGADGGSGVHPAAPSAPAEAPTAPVAAAVSAAPPVVAGWGVPLKSKSDQGNEMLVVGSRGSKKSSKKRRNKPNHKKPVLLFASDGRRR